MKKLIIVFLFAINLVANDIYLLPKESNLAKERIRYEILSAKESIFLAMYKFTYPKIARELIKASRNGVKVTVLLDKEKAEDEDEVFELLKEKNIKVVFDKSIEKMHLKAMLIDNNLAMVGSLNFTKESFEKNLDLIYFSKDRRLINRLKELRAKFK